MNNDESHSVWLKLCITIDRGEEGRTKISIVEEKWEDSPPDSFEATLTPEELEVFWEELVAWAEQKKKGSGLAARRDGDIADMFEGWGLDEGQ